MANQERVAEAVALYKQGRKKDAVDLVSQVLREDRKDANAWYTLGVMVDDLTQKRQAFETAIRLQPDHVRAQAALEKLNSGINGSATTGPTAGATSSAFSGTTAVTPTTPASGTNSRSSTAAATAGAAATGALKVARTGATATGRFLNRLYINGFRMPVVVEGAPSHVTGPYLAAQIPPQVGLSLRLLRAPDPSVQEGTSIDATWWDAIFPAIAASVLFALTTLGGLFIRNVLRWFVPRSGITLGMIVLSPIFAALVSAGAAAGGLALGVFAASFYLESQGIKIAWREHTQYAAQFWLPIILILAVVRFVAHFLAGFLGNGFVYPFATIAALVAAVFCMMQLSKTYGRMYGEGNSRHLIIASLTLFVALFATLLMLTLLGALFRIPLL